MVVGERPGQSRAGIWLAFFLVVIFGTTFTILADIPFLRQILAFLCYTLIPGLLITFICKLHYLETAKKIVLSVGLSVAFLMLIGLLINWLYPAAGISEPLSTRSLTLSFGLLLSILTILAYIRNKNELAGKQSFNVNLSLGKDKLISPLLISLFFPFLSILGRYYMDLTGSNVILLTMLLAIPAYVAVITYLSNRIPKATYPVAILMISVALLLMHSLNTEYIIGDDIGAENRAFLIVVQHLFWSMADNDYNVLTACLSTSLLPTIYYSLVDIERIYVYKLLYQLIFAITPVIAFYIFKEYVEERYAFLAAFFIMAQWPFVYILQSSMRQEIAILFFALALLVYFDKKPDALIKKVLILLFFMGMVVSHYTVAYIAFFLFLFLIMVSELMQPFFSNRSVTAVMVLLFFSFIFLWYAQVTQTSFSDTVGFLGNTVKNLGNFFVVETKAEAARLVTTGSSSSTATETVTRLQETSPTKIPDLLNVRIHQMSIALITIGTISVLLKRILHRDTQFDGEYIVMMTCCFGFCAAAILLPYLSQGYGIERVYFQALFILAPAFVIGGVSIFQLIKFPRLGLIFVLIVLTAQFFSGMYLVYQFCGVPYSEDLNTVGPRYSIYIPHEEDSHARAWLGTNRPSYAIKIHQDYIMRWGRSIRYTINEKFFRNNQTIDNGYIYLWSTNLKERKVYVNYDYFCARNLEDYSHLFTGKSKIYTNNLSEVWK